MDDIIFSAIVGAIYVIRNSLKGLRTSLYNGKIKSVELIGHIGKLAIEQNVNALEITLPESKPCEHAFVFKIMTE